MSRDHAGSGSFFRGLPDSAPGLLECNGRAPELNRKASGLERKGILELRNRERKDLFPGALEMMILRTLQRQPLHGYALAQHIKRTSNDLLQIEEGSLYPALQRILKEGWVKARGGVSPSGRRVRIYELTPAGSEHLQREMLSFERMLAGIRLVLSPVKS
jgi:PadR family transcriptional regulator